MNKRAYSFLLMLGLLLPVMTAGVAGQAGLVLTVDVPFQFTACSKQLPAGKYRVQPISSANPRLLQVKGDDGSSVEIICTRDVTRDGKDAEGKLIFNRYGDQYFLSELWFAGQTTGNQLAKTEAEEELSARKHEKVTISVKEIKP